MTSIAHSAPTRLYPTSTFRSLPSIDPNWGPSRPGNDRGGPPQTWVIVVAVMGGLFGIGLIVILLSYCGKDQRRREYRSYNYEQYGFPTTGAAPPPYSRFDEEAGVLRPPVSHPRHHQIHSAAHNMHMHNHHLATHHSAHHTAHHTAMSHSGAGGC